jgi:hypothetical protein
VLERRAGVEKPFTIQNGRVEGSRIQFDQVSVCDGLERVTHWFARLDLKAGAVHLQARRALGTASCSADS